MKINKCSKRLAPAALCISFLAPLILNPASVTYADQSIASQDGTSSYSNSSITLDSDGPGYSSSNSDSESRTTTSDDPGATDTANTLSPDASDYADTGGVATGTMTISTYIPEGALSVLPLNVANPIVDIKDKYSYDDMYQDLVELQKSYPQYMSYMSIGTTADKREIYQAIVGNPSADTHILITGAIHAREYITTLLVMKQMEYILYFADTGAFDGRFIRDWLGDVCIHFVPMINPDGVTISQVGEGGLGSADLRQKLHLAYSNDTINGRTSLGYNRYLTRWKANANGVNLNDNFDVASPKVGLSTFLPSSGDYYGTPGSEAETQALQNLVNNQHFKAAINYHAMGCVIYWNYTGNPLVEHSRDLSNNIWALTGYTLLFTGDEGGSFKGYLGSLSNPVTAITIEVGRSEAPVNISEFGTIWSENMFVPFYTMKWAQEKGR